jgi:hypothetical protein
MLPDGQRISQERVIDVDRSGYAIVPVRVVREDAPTEPVEGVVVEASGRLYEWRSRLWSATTDEAGMASIKVEALAQAPTRYVIRVAPGVREGMMVEATTSAELVLPPGSTSAPPVVLEVRLRSGVITGRALEPDEGYLKSVNVWAIDEGDLNCYRATTNKAGGFIFWDLPMGNYRVAVDPTELAEAGFLGEPESVDLSRSPVSRITLTSSDFPGPIVKGEVLDERGSPIPFSRISFDGIGLPGGSSPSSRTWWTSVSALPTAMVVSAPGYYSRSVEVVEGEPDAAPLEVSMVRRPETSSLKWGVGEVILPPESGYTLAGRVIELRSGWLWGSGGGDPISVRTPSVTMDIGSGSFAIELGPGSNGWLYVYDGTALLRPSDAADTMLVHPGEVARIRANGPSASATFCPILDAALADGSRLSIPDVWEPNAIQAQIDRLRNLGVSAAMIITLVTYSLGMLLLVLLPLSVLSSLRRRR